MKFIWPLKSALSLALVMILSIGAGASEPVDRIAAIVGNDLILTSELAAQIQMTALQRGIRPQSKEDAQAFQAQVLEQMISEKLFLVEARKDTSIRVSADEVEKALDNHIADISGQFTSEDQFLSELAKEGLTLRSFRKRLYPEVENQLLKQKLIGKKLSSITISRQEVLEFYNKYGDSIPDQPEAVRLAHILITFQPSGKTEDSIRQLAESVRKNAAAGAEFATLAATYSPEQFALAGGDLGFVSREDVVPEFARAAFNLVPGEISGVVRTQFGFHVIKCEELAPPKAHLRHILFEVLPTAADSQLSYKLIDSLINEVRQGVDFRELAKAYSADNDTRKQGGELGWFAVSDLPAEFQVALDSLKEIGNIHGPVPSQYGLHILKLLEHQDARDFSFETDFDRVKEMARQSKTGQIVDEWVKEVKKRTFVEIRPL